MSNSRGGSRLSEPGFKREQLAEAEKAEVMAQFGGEGLVTDVLGMVGDGKEATVYLCAAHESVGVEYLAAKVYRADKFRAFRGGRTYAGERTALDSRSTGCCATSRSCSTAIWSTATCPPTTCSGGTTAPGSSTCRSP